MAESDTQPADADFDTVFKPQADQSFDDVFKPVAEKPEPHLPGAFGTAQTMYHSVFPQGIPMSKDEWSNYMDTAPAGRIMSAFGKPFTGAPEMDDETVDALRKAGIFNDVRDKQDESTRGFAEGIVRPIVTGTRAFNESLIRGASSAFETGLVRPFEGTLGLIAQSGQEADKTEVGGAINKVLHTVGLGTIGELTRDIAGEFERRGTVGDLGMHPTLPEPIARGRTNAVIGEGEDGYFGKADTTQADIDARLKAAGQMPETPVAQHLAEAPPEPREPAAAPTIHDVVRQQNPALFNEFDALQARQETYARWTTERADEARTQLEEKPPAELADIDSQIAEAERKLENAGARTREKFETQIDDLHDRRADMLDDLVRNDPTLGVIRRDAEAERARIAELAPDVTRAYRDAAEVAPEAEKVPESTLAAEATEPVGAELGETRPAEPIEVADEKPPVDESVGNAPETVPPETTPAAPSEPEPVTSPDQVDAIKKAVSERLVALGRDPEIANADASVVAAYYDTWARRLGGKLGSAREMFNRYFPEARSGRQPSKVRELAQNSDELHRNIRDVIDAADRPGHSKANATYAAASDWLVDAARKAGLRIEGYVHSIDGSAVRHMRNNHGDVGTEKSRGQIALSDHDIVRIPDILGAPDHVVFGAESGIGRPIIAYAKKMEDGSILVLEEVRSGRRQLATLSMRKYPPTMNMDSVLSTLDLYGRADGGNALNIVQPEAGATALKYGRDLDQSRNGYVSDPYAEGRRIMTLLKTADASTVMHESAHLWLADLMHFSSIEGAPADVVQDADTVLKWLGVDREKLREANASGSGFSREARRANEKFARGFETYLMEGRAPSRGLAKVFEQFRDWLTKIYQSVTALKSPINDEVRGVFDRFLTTKPEHVTIAPELERPGGIADIHEADAERATPAEAKAVADKIHTELATEIRSKAPELEPDVRLEPAAAEEHPRDEPGEGAPQRPSADGGEPAAGPEPGAEGRVQGPGEVGAGRSEGEGEGAGGEPGEGERITGHSFTGSNAGAADAAKLGETGFNPDAAFKKGKDGKDLAGNIRLENLRTSDDVDAMLREWARNRNDLLDARHNEESYHGQLQVEAARALLCDVAQSTLEAERTFAETGAEADAVVLEQWRERLNMVGDRVATLAAGAGRTLAAFRKMKGVEEIRARLNGRDLFQLQQQAALNAQLTTPAQLAHAARIQAMTTWQRGKSMIIEYFVNNLISGPITHSAYAVSNLVTAISKPLLETPLAAAAGKIKEIVTGKPVERVHLDEAKAQLFGLGRGFSAGFPAAWRALKSGVPELLPGETSTQLPGLPPQAAKAIYNIPGVVGQVVNVPSRVVGAIHTFGRSVNYEAEKAALIFRQATKEGLTGDAFNRRVAELDANPTPEIMDAAAKEATHMVLMDRSKYDSLTAKLSAVTNQSLVAKLALPFVQVGSNLLHGGLVERSPVGVFEQQIRDNLSGKNGEIARDIQAGKIAAGTAIATGVLTMAAQGLITGTAPHDPKEASLWRMTGKQPYSLRVGDHWVPYRKWLGWFGPLVGMTANTYQVGHTLGQEGLGAAATAAVFGFSEVVADESWFHGVSNFVEAVENWQTKGEQYIRNLALDFIPFSVGMQQVARLVDPYQRRAQTFLDGAINHMPGVSEELQPQRDIFGEPIASHAQVTPTRVNNDPVMKEMLRLEVWPRQVDKKIRGVELTPEQYDDYARIAGRKAKMELDQIVDNPNWGQVPGHVQRKMLMSAVSHARESARSTIIAQSVGGANDIMAKAIDAKTQTRNMYDEARDF